MRLELLDDLPGAEILFVGVGAGEVEVELVSEGFSQEVAAAEERFQVEELIFDEAVDGFDIALEGVSSGWDADVLAVAESGGKAGAVALAIVAAEELGAVVGLPDQIAKGNPAALQMLLDAGGEGGAGGGGAALREGPEEQAATDVAGGVLDGGQIEGLGLGPIVGKVVEVLGVGGDLLKDAPGGFDVGKILLALILAAARAEQAVGAPDAFQGAMAEGKIELADEAAGAEGRQLLTESEDLLFDDGGGFAGLMMRGAGKFEQAARSVLLIAAQPFAHGRRGGLKQAGSGLDAVLAGVRDETQAMVVSASHFPYQGEVGSGHGCGL